MTKPAVLVNDTKRVMPQLAITSVNVMRKSRGDADVMRLSSARPGLLMANTTAKSAIGIDDTVHSRDMSQKALKAIFEASKAGKPETDFLTDCKYKPIQYLGTGGIVPTKYKSKVPSGNRPGITNQEVVTKKYEQFAVYSDFPKGPGGIEPNKLWQDGTYNEMMAQVTKEREALPEHITFLAPDSNSRVREFNLAGQVGGQLFGDALHRSEIEKYFKQEQDAYNKRLFMNQGKTEEEAERMIKGLAKERSIAELSKKLGLSEASTRTIFDEQFGNVITKAPVVATSAFRERAGEEIERGLMGREEAIGRMTINRRQQRDIVLPHNIRVPTAPVVGAGAGDGALQNIRVIDGIRTMFLNL